MRIEYTAVITAALLIWHRAKVIYDELSKIVEPIIREIEKRAQDGKIDKKDRKEIVMAAISEAEKSGKIKLNFLSRIIVSRVVDKIAARLPDFNISQGVVEIVNNVVVK